MVWRCQLDVDVEFFLRLLKGLEEACRFRIKFTIDVYGLVTPANKGCARAARDVECTYRFDMIPQVLKNFFGFYFVGHWQRFVHSSTFVL